MLKKIAVSDLCLGMHLHALCGNWLNHPFWRAKFVMTDPADLAMLRASGIAECWIDDEKGAALPACTPPAVVPVDAVFPVHAAPPHAEPAAPPKSAPSTACSMADELEHAGRLMAQSRTAVMALFGEARLGRTMNTEQCAEVVGEITASVWRNPGALVSLARLKTHDDYSYMHSVAVCVLMVSLSRQLGHDESQARDAGMGGLLHDMGKALMPIEVLNKPGKLTDAEYTLIKRHPELGHELLVGGDAPRLALDVCLHHHERPDGCGYPFGLAGSALTQAARMGAVCDVYDAITSNRPYKSGWDPAESIAQMADWTKQHQFDPAIFSAFLTGLGVYPTGSLVRLKSGRLAVVVEQNVGALSAPVVKVFFSTRSQMPVTAELLDLAKPRCVDRIVARESNRVWQFKHLDELWAGREVLDKLARAQALAASVRGPEVAAGKSPPENRRVSPAASSARP